MTAETWAVSYTITAKTRPKAKKVEGGEILSDEKTIKKGTLKADSLDELRKLINTTSHKWLCGRRGSGRTMSHDLEAKSSSGRKAKI